jgi:hypothetical protein
VTIPLEFLIDACPECGTRNPTFPLSADVAGQDVHCAYRCTAGHAWTCNWRDEWDERAGELA